MRCHTFFLINNLKRLMGDQFYLLPLGVASDYLPVTVGHGFPTKKSQLPALERLVGEFLC